MANEALVHTEVQAIDRGMMPLAEVVARVRRIQEVMTTLMKVNVHYGTIPGTPKPSLYQPGAELLCTTFRIAPEPTIEDLSTAETVRYRVTMRGSRQTTGELLGEGVGECSSDESKYRWCRPICDEEFAETPDDRKRMKWMRGKGENYRQLQIRMSPADIANTILKMAYKRALISMARVTLACSDIFAQDLEDLPPEVRDAVLDAEREEAPQKPPIQTPRAKSDNGKTTVENPTGTNGMVSGHVPPQADTDMTALRVTGIDAQSWEKKDAEGHVKQGHVFYITFSDGRVAATFSATVARLAEVCRDEQAPIEALIEESKKHKGKFNLTELTKIPSEPVA